MRIFASWKYRIESPGQYSVLVFSDMSSTKGTTVATSYGGILEKTLLKGYPVGRAAYAEYAFETRVE